MRTTQIGRWLEKNNKPFVALLAAGATLAMATLIDASSSSQIEQLGPLAVPRTGHAATALVDGRVVITGGRDSAGIFVATAEVFDPANETSTAVGMLNTARIDHTATLLADGRVLIAGGTAASGAVTSVEIFDPANPGAGFRVLSATMAAARTRHTATRLHNGTVLIAGGDAAGTAEIFNPTTETFSSALLAMAAPRIGHTATLFSDDSVLLAGGNTDSMEYFSSIDQTFTLDPAKLTATRTGHDAISLSDTRLLFFGGDIGHTIDEFNTSADTLSLKATMDGASSSATLLANGRILVLRPDAAGLYAPDATDQATAFTPFDETLVPGSTALLRSGQTATELSGDKKILVAGGQNAQHQPSLQIVTFNPARIWTDKDDYMPDDPVLLFGSGWKPNENVYLYAVDSETEQWTYESTVAADSNGTFALQPYFIVQLRQLGTMFTVDAVGAQSNMQAEVAFTDAINFQQVSVGSQSGTAVAGVAASVTYPITGNYNNGGGQNNDDPVTLSFLGWTGGTPAGVTASFSPTSITVGSPNSTLTLQTSAATTVAGTFTFTVRATTAGGQQKTGTGTLTIAPGAATTLALSGSTGNLTSGATRVLTATIQDANGNTVTSGPNSTLSVTFAQTTGTGSVTGLGSVNASSGVANITVTGGQPGSVTIAASGGGLAQGTGNPITFTVVVGAASKLALSGSTSDLSAGATRVLTATIQDANGNTITTGASSILSVTFANTAGTGTVTGLGSVNAVAGVATLTVTGNQAGSITITASAPGLTAGTGNPITFNIVASAASKIALSGSTANLTAGATRALTAIVQDSAGNTITTGPNSTQSITFTKTAGTGNVSGLSSVNAVAGVANITVTGTTAGPVTIAASGGGLAAGTGNPITFTVVASTTVDHFSFSNIGTQTAGTAFNITITAQDAGNNTVVGYSGNGFKVKLTSTGALVGAPVTTPAFTNGVLTNQSVTITNTGNFAITATDTSGGTSATGISNSFDVVAADVATTLVLNSVSPNSVPYGSTGPVTFTGTLTRTNGGAAVSGATVNFTVDGSAAGSGITNGSGVATFTTYNPSALSVASHSVQASFTATTLGGVSYLASTSSTLPLAVTKATPTITWANPGDITYGTALSGTQLNATASVPGTFTYTPAAGTVPNAGAGQTLHVDFAPTDTTHYSDASADVTINVLKATPTVTWANPADITYGTALSGAQLNATFTWIVDGSPVSVPGTATYTPAAGTVPNAGAGQTLHVAFAPTNTTNYNSASKDVTIDVLKATPTAALKVTNSPTTYNGNGQAANVIVDSSSVPGHVANVLTGDAATQTNAATYAVTADFVPTDSDNYNTLTGLSAGNFVINKATPTVTVSFAASPITYDGNPHAASASVTGVGGANISTGHGTLTVSYTPGGNNAPVNAGSYTASAHFASTDDNYNNADSTTPASLTIDKATPTVTVSFATSPITFDGDPHPASASVTGVGGANISTGHGTLTVSYTPGGSNAPVNAGSYSASAHFASTDDNYNNADSTTPASLTIDKRPATWTTNPNSKIYGEADPDPVTTGSAVPPGPGTGFLAADGISATYSRAAGEKAGPPTYHITATLAPLAALDNYVITNDGAEFTINKRPATWTTNANSKVYGEGDPNPVTTGSAVPPGPGTGFLAADGVTATYSRATGETVLGGPYHITATLSPTDVLDNYIVTNNGASFTINTRPATWTTNDNSKTYGDLDPTPLTMGSAVAPGPGTGFLVADNVTATYSRAMGETVLGGPYHITANLGPAGVLSNYSITNNGASFTINTRPATWTTNNNSKVYGETDPNPLTSGNGSNFVAADNVTATYTRATGETVLGGPYHITANLGPAGVLSNYSITNTGASFTINTRPATWTTNANSKTYGMMDPSPVTTGSAVAQGPGTGFLAADGVTATYSRAAGENASPPTYHITATLAPTGVLSNYSVTNAGAEFTINKAHLTVTAADKTKVFDNTPYSPFTATLSGFVNGETDSGLRSAGALSGAAAFTGDAITAYLPGTYTITPTIGTLAATNYDFTPFTNGKLTITYGTCSGSVPGILPPINSDGTSVYQRKGGSTIPVKFQVCDAFGNPISNPSAVFGPNGGATITMLSAVRGTVDTVNEVGVNTIPDAGFRYTGGQWIFNMATTNLAAGTTYTFRINLAYDPASIVFKIGVK
jgi:hypothetical protein